MYFRLHYFDIEVCQYSLLTGKQNSVKTKLVQRFLGAIFDLKVKGQGYCTVQLWLGRLPHIRSVLA